MPIIAIVIIAALYVAFGGFAAWGKTIANAPNTIFGKLFGIVSGAFVGIFAAIGRIFKLLTGSIKLAFLFILVVIIYFIVKGLGWIG